MRPTSWFVLVAVLLVFGSSIGVYLRSSAVCFRIRVDSLPVAPERSGGGCIRGWFSRIVVTVAAAILGPWKAC